MAGARFPEASRNVREHLQQKISEFSIRNINLMLDAVNHAGVCFLDFQKAKEVLACVK